MHEECLTNACFKQSQVEDAFDAQTGPHKEEFERQKEDLDLQSAVARLAAIRSAVQGRDLRHLRLQDLQVSLASFHHMCRTGIIYPFFASVS